MKKVFVIRWGSYGYVSKTHPRGRQPYVTFSSEARHWKSRKGAEKYLSIKDKVWASMCTVQEIELANP